MSIDFPRCMRHKWGGVGEGEEVTHQSAKSHPV